MELALPLQMWDESTTLKYVLYKRDNLFYILM